MMLSKEIRQKAIKLRLQGKLYPEISSALGMDIPKSTMWYWFRNLDLSEEVIQRLAEAQLDNLSKARDASVLNRWIERQEFCEQVRRDNGDLPSLIDNKGVAKIVLAILFLAEGSKRSDNLVFCNSDPFVIRLFLHLLRFCYRLSEDKFRCTVQCRSDQDIKELESFWSDITNIPLHKFYRAQVDSRSIGKPTQKPGYKGVCRLDYFDGTISKELALIPKIIYQGR